MKKLAIITSHPIQYNAPLFRLLTERRKIKLKVFYTWGQTEQGIVYDPDFKKEFKWDVPLLDGYDKVFVENISKKPGAGHFNGIQNKNLVSLIDEYNPDAILVFGWSFRSHLSVLRFYKNRKKILFRGDSTLLDEGQGFSFSKLLRRLFLTRVYRYVDIALYTGTANRAYYLKHGLKPDQLLYAPHAIENDRFFDVDELYEKRAAKWRTELGISSSALVFLFAGKLEPKKDPFLLIDAFRSIENPACRLIIVGNGVLEGEIKKRTATDGRIILLGFQNQQQMPIVYRLGDVFVLPSRGPGETWGLSVNEAMACGRPVLVSDKCGCAEDLVNGNGFIFKAGDVADLMDKMKLLINSENRGIMGSLSRKFIDKFNHVIIAESIEDALCN